MDASFYPLSHHGSLISSIGHQRHRARMLDPKPSWLTLHYRHLLFFQAVSQAHQQNAFLRILRKHDVQCRYTYI